MMVVMSLGWCCVSVHVTTLLSEWLIIGVGLVFWRILSVLLM